MARPSRCRRICLEPEYDRFAPCGVSDGEQIVLTVDEYEAVRLIDFEKKTHEQCSAANGDFQNHRNRNVRNGPV